MDDAILEGNQVNLSQNKDWSTSRRFPPQPCLATNKSGLKSKTRPRSRDWPLGSRYFSQLGGGGTSEGVVCQWGVAHHWGVGFDFGPDKISGRGWHPWIRGGRGGG